MNRLQNYVFRQLLTSMVFITLTLTAVLWLTQSMRFVKYILNRGLELSTFFEVTMLLIPGFWLVILPISLFFATLFTYSKITNDRELVVMRAAGIGQFGLAKPALVMGLAVVGICYFISLYLMPVAFREFRELQTEIRTKISSALIQEGTFNNITKGLTIYVRHRQDNEMRGIVVQDSRQKNVRVTILAESGVIVPTPQGPRVVLLNGNRQERRLDNGRVSMLYFSRNSFQLAQTGKPKKLQYVQPEERFLPQLLYPADTQADRFYRTRLIAQGHNRILAPWLGLVLPLVALAVLLSGEFNKRGQIVRQISACAIVAGIEGAAIGLVSITSKINELIPLAYLNVILALGVFFWILLRGKRHPRRFDSGPAPGGTRFVPDEGELPRAVAGAAE